MRTNLAGSRSGESMTELDKARQEWKAEWLAQKAVLDYRNWLEKKLFEARTAELTAYLEACKAVDAEQVTDTGSSEDTAYNIALENAVRAIRSLPRFAELNAIKP